MTYWITRWISFFSVVTLIASFNADAHGFQLVVEKSEDPAIQQASKGFLTEVEGKLPDSVKAALGQEIEIGFADIEPDWAKRCEWNRIMGIRLGRIEKHKIWLEKSFRNELITGDRLSSENGRDGCGYANGYRFAMGVLIHQLALLYDQKANWSKDPRLATLLGSAEIGGMMPRRRVGEEISRRTPDISEFESAKEGLAVNFEHYAMDPEFACRRPTIARFFATELGWNPFPLRPCEVNDVVPLSQEEIKDTLVRLVHLDPKRLYQVHYLFASKGEQVMSRWGHAMFRLVFCSPKRSAPGPECLKDVSYHVVASFRANVEGFEIDPIKGLTGEYPSQLYLLSMLEVMREYNTDELRDLISLPLNLTREEALDFLNRSLQVFWEYSGRYQFVSNNCATEALNLLKSIVPDLAFQENVHVVTPLGLYNELLASGLMDDRILHDLKQAQKEGYFFPSEKERLIRTFGELPRSPQWDSLERYLSESTAGQRLAWFSELSGSVDNGGPGERGQLASRFFILESYLVRMHEVGFFKKLVALLRDDRSRASLDPDGTLRSSIEHVKSIEESLAPQGLAPKGYGIALGSDYLPDLEQKEVQARSELLRLLGLLKQTLENRFSDQYREFLGTVENRKAFARALKE